MIEFQHWSKDLIILISDGGLMGTQVWLDAYYGEQHSLNNNGKIYSFFFIA